MAEFENTIPDWENEGEEPTSERKKTGFEPQYKPPAAYFNWFWNLVLKSLKELQSKVATTADLDKHKNDKTNSHGVTAAQVGAHDIKNRGTLIPNNADLDNYKTVGVYYSPDAAVTNTLKHSPIGGKGFKMTVEQLYGMTGGHLAQRIITWNHAVYYRQFSNDAWGEWVKSYDTLNKPTAAEVDSHALSERGVQIPASSNLDDYKTAGDYYVAGASDAKTITNSPMTGSGYRLIVETGYVLGYIRQYAIGVSGNIQTRYFQQSWTPWMKLVTDTDLKDNIYYHSTQQLTNEDLNDVKMTGHYYAAGSNTCANSPAPSGSGFGLEVVQTAGGYYTQLCFVANVIHIRYFNGSTWGTWQTVYSSNNLGIIPINKGGTGETSIAAVREKFGIPSTYVVASDDELFQIKGATVTATSSANHTQAEYKTLEKQFRITMDGNIKITGTASRSDTHSTDIDYSIYLNDNVIDSYSSPWGTGDLEREIDETVSVKAGDILKCVLKVGAKNAVGTVTVKIEDFWIKGTVKFVPMVAVEAV